MVLRNWPNGLGTRLWCSVTFSDAPPIFSGDFLKLFLWGKYVTCTKGVVLDGQQLVSKSVHAGPFKPANYV